jgi:hypothetical protein
VVRSDRPVVTERMDKAARSEERDKTGRVAARGELTASVAGREVLMAALLAVAAPNDDRLDELDVGPADAVCAPRTTSAAAAAATIRSLGIVDEIGNRASCSGRF